MLLCNIQIYLIIIIYDASSDWLDIHVTGETKRRVYRRMILYIVFHSFQENFYFFLKCFMYIANIAFQQVRVNSLAAQYQNIWHLHVWLRNQQHETNGLVQRKYCGCVVLLAWRVTFSLDAGQFTIFNPPPYFICFCFILFSWQGLFLLYHYIGSELILGRKD